jgi:hypothetical protein
MSKTNKRSSFMDRWNDEEDEFNTIDKNKDHKKQKRLVNALRSKNINHLIELEEDDD